MWPRRTPGRAARPHGAARSRIPLWRAPRLPISFCPFAGLRRNSRFPPHTSRPVARGGFPLCAHRGLLKSDGCLWGVLLVLLTGFACFRFLAPDCCAMLPRSTTRPDWGHSCVVARRNVVRVVAGCSNATAGCCDLRVVGFAALMGSALRWVMRVVWLYLADGTTHICVVVRVSSGRTPQQNATRTVTHTHTHTQIFTHVRM